VTPYLRCLDQQITSDARTALLQALISDTGLRSPYTADIVTAQYSNGVSTVWRSRSQAKLPFVTMRHTVCEMLSFTGFDFASCLEYNSIGTVFVECSAPFYSLEADDARMVCIESVDPPTKDS
jgi:hypothetical protein